VQLREKQKARRYYGVLEKQFRNYYDKASRQDGVTGENLLRLLESRFDNVLVRLGFAGSRRQARQLILHGHWTINGRRVNVPSYQVRADDVIAIKAGSGADQVIRDATELTSAVPAWLQADHDGLTAKVLRVVNSAYYGLSGQVTSLAQAVVILGMHQIRNLVLSMSAISQLQPKTAGEHEILRTFWLHSFGTAAATQLIAKRKHFNIRDAETVFVGGLLHDIGRLFLHTNFARTYDQVLKYAETRDVAMEEAENLLLGMSHGDLGALMVEHWKLPAVLSELIGAHEGPFDAHSDPMLFAIHIGDWLTKHLYSDLEILRPAEASEVAVQWLGFSDEDFIWLRAETELKIDEAAGLFGLMAA
jgi:ribosomal protein S4